MKEFASSADNAIYVSIFINHKNIFVSWLIDTFLVFFHLPLGVNPCSWTAGICVVACTGEHEAPLHALRLVIRDTYRK